MLQCYFKWYIYTHAYSIFIWLHLGCQGLLSAWVKLSSVFSSQVITHLNTVIEWMKAQPSKTPKSSLVLL